MKCRKQLVLTGYRVQFVDLREPKPRTPREEIHVADRQWLDALGVIGKNATGIIREQYAKAGYEVFSVEQIKPKRTLWLDLCELWNEAESPATITNEEETAV